MAGLFQKPWPEEVKQRALVLSETLGVAEASARTGVPEGTIQRWREALPKEEPAAGDTETGESAGGGRRPATRPALKEAAAEAFAEARAQVLPHVVKRLSQLTNQLCDLAQQSLDEWQRMYDEVCGRTTGKPRTPTGAEIRWARTMVGAAGQAMKQAYLASGVPANRIELVGKLVQREEHEINVIHRIISDPAALDIGDQLLERLASLEPGGAGLDN